MTATTPIRFEVFGNPLPMPRHRFRVCKNASGGNFARPYTTKEIMEWKALVYATALTHRPPSPMTGAVCVKLTFYIPRPKSHFGTGKNSETIKDRYRYAHHTSKPDIDNLAKPIYDALTRAGMWEDDRQIVVGMIFKGWSGTRRGKVAIEVARVPDVRHSD